ncbi:hypothetical protein [Inquilinus sp. OTU3971]|uniref:hypothetical protein n=1 Tax=Inquilinus sp. OTU3971 TaxID=3043855 RepID=UPI00313DB7D3
MNDARTVSILAECLEAMRARHLRFRRAGQELLPRERAKFCSATRLLRDAIACRDETLLDQALTCLRNDGSSTGSIMIEPKTRHYTASTLGLDVRDLADLCRGLQASGLPRAADPMGATHRFTGSGKP